MFIPIGTDRAAKRTPLVTQGLIVANMLVYLAGLIGQFAGSFDGGLIAMKGHFDPQHVQLWQMITYQFIHDPNSVFHLVFNMLFLWIFGAPVESRLGRLGFLGFYLVGGIAAALGHAVVSKAPVIGASGSVSAVTGAFLALFPRSRIKVIVVFFIIGIFQIPAIWFIGFFFIVDFLRQAGNLLGRGTDQVAYAAHLTGYVYGFGVGFALLATGLLKREEFDIFYLWRQARRRAVFRSAGRDLPGGLYESSSADTGRRLERRQAGQTDPMPTAHRELRASIARHIEAHDTPAAAREYGKLLQLDPSAVLSEQRQLDVANQLFAEQRWDEASQAYELLLEQYPYSVKSNEVRLILGTVYARYLDRGDRARELVRAARERVRAPEQITLADQLLEELDA